MTLVTEGLPKNFAPRGATKKRMMKRLMPIAGIRKKAVFAAFSISSFLLTKAESKPKLLKMPKPSIITKARANSPKSAGLKMRAKITVAPNESTLCAMLARTTHFTPEIVCFLSVVIF